MEQREIAEKIRARFPEIFLDVVTFQGQTAVLLRPWHAYDVLEWLKDADETRMDHLRTLCGVDNSTREGNRLPRFEVVYELYSTELRHGIRVRTLIPDGNPHTASVTPLWMGANWLEREVFDMFGIRFDNHPNMARVLMPEDWDGYPLLKDYPLRGKGEWQGMAHLKEKAADLDQYGFYGQREDIPGAGRKENANADVADKQAGQA